MQLSEWEAYDKLDPIGEWRGDFRMATLSSLIMNGLIAHSGDKDKEMTTPLDFMPDWDGTEEKEVIQQSVAEQKRILLGMAGRPKKRTRKAENLKPSKRGPPMKRKG